MTKRFNEALSIIEGASNPAGVALALHEACKEVIAEEGSQKTDPAIRLIAFQLSHILDVGEIDGNLDIYRRLRDECKAKAEA